MHGQNAGQAYDAIADDYDRQLREASWMREILWKRYAHLIGPDDHVLDVGCGTGADTLFLARRGVRVTAIDVSERMIARLKDAAEREGVAGQIEPRVTAYEELGDWEPESFDAIISAFAALNTTPDLARFAEHAARLLRPHGHLVVHLLNDSSVWTRLRLLSQGRWPAAAHRTKNRRRMVNIGGVALQHYLYSPEDAYARAFSPCFELRRAYGMGILRPAGSAPRVPPPVLRALGNLEAPIRAHRPFLGWGEFFVLELERRNGRARSAVGFQEAARVFCEKP